MTFFFFFFSLGGSATASLCGKTQEGGRGGQSTRGSGDAPTNRLLPFERMRRISRIGAREEAASRGRRERGIGRKRDGMVRVMSLARARGVRGSVAPPEACVGRRSGNASAPSDARGAESADAPEKRARTRSAPSWAASRAPADPTRGPTLDLTPRLRVRRVGVRLPGRRARRECATPCQNGLRKAAESLRAARQWPRTLLVQELVSWSWSLPRRDGPRRPGRPTDLRSAAPDRGAATMASTPGAYNYVVTVRADLPPRPRFFVFLSLIPARARC